MKVNIVENYLDTGMVSITLDSRHEGVRSKRRIPNLLYDRNPSTTEDWGRQRQLKQIVSMIKDKMESEPLFSDFMLSNEYDLKGNFFAYAEILISHVFDNDQKLIKVVNGKLKTWVNQDNLPFAVMTQELMKEFKQNLDLDKKGKSYYHKKLQSILKRALTDKHLTENPEGLKDSKPRNLINETLMARCIAKRAFILSCLEGLQYYHLKELSWNDMSDDLKNFIPNKTRRQMDLESDPNKLVLRINFKKLRRSFVELSNFL